MNNNFMKSIIYTRGIHGFGVSFTLPTISLHSFVCKNVILLVSLKKINIYIIC